ncbi:hypothetical protein [Nostoc sp.]|uniref:hypothetical protein n=1 Tax=Nostoc sp. TaxID=1180 RepID=UPI002FF881EC
MADANLILQCSGQIKAPMRLRFVFEVAMSNDKPRANGNVSGSALCVYAVLLRFSERRSLLGMCEVRSHSIRFG